MFLFSPEARICFLDKILPINITKVETGNIERLVCRLRQLKYDPADDNEEFQRFIQFYKNNEFTTAGHVAPMEKK